MKVARVFPKKTKYTPDDKDSYTDGPNLFTPHYDEALVSCLFTWDKPKAEQLAEMWKARADVVKIGGPAYDDPGGEFTPGMFVKKGYVQTSRGCLRKCPFCFVNRREGKIRELIIHSGPWLMDNNILACSEKHQDAVFEMLSNYNDVKLLGGLDIRLFTDHTYNLLEKIRKNIRLMYIAYDNPSQSMTDTFEEVISRLYEIGFKQSQIWCFVLVGYSGDTPEEALKRVEFVFSRGAVPFASYYRGPEDSGSKRPKEWEFVRWWTYAPLIFSRTKRLGLKYYKPIR